METTMTIEQRQKARKELMKSMKVQMKYDYTTVDAYINLKPDGTLVIVPEEPTEAIRKIEIPNVDILF